MSTTRHTIENGLLLIARCVTGADGREYLAGVLEYQVYDLNGTPAALTYRGLATVNGSTIVIGDPQRDIRLHEATVSETPTQRSQDQFDGFCAGITAKRRPTAAQWERCQGGVEWRDGYQEAWRQRLSAKRAA